MLALCAIALSLTAAEPTPAKEAPPPVDSAEPAQDVAAAEAPAEPRQPRVLAGVKLGGIFPQVLGRLSTHFIVAIELGWVTPLIGHRLAVVGEVTYSQPPRSQTTSDPRVGGGEYTFTVTERTVGIYFGPKFFVLPPASRVVPWVSLGGRVQFVDSRMVASAGEDFGQHDETGTHFAFGGQLGCGLRLGPGLLGLELQLISSPLDHLVTGASNIGDLAVRAAYLFTF